jgi:hypothetical protein
MTTMSVALNARLVHVKAHGNFSLHNPAPMIFLARILYDEHIVQLIRED